MGNACYGGCIGSSVVDMPMSAPVISGGMVPSNVAPVIDNKIPAPVPDKKEEPKKISDNGSAPATLVVVLPADAKLTVDGTATRATSAERTFVSPTLEQGQEYFYTLRAEVQKDGSPVVVSKQVAIRAGELTRVVLEFPEASIVQK